MKKFFASLSVITALTAFAPPPAEAVVISEGTYVSIGPFEGGALTTSGYLWNDGNASFSWIVEENAGLYTYTYSWHNLVSPDPHYILIQAAPEFSTENILSGTTAGVWLDTFIGGASNGNPGMSGSMYALQFDVDSSFETFTLVTDFAPMAGSMLAPSDKVNGIYVLGRTGNFDNDQLYDFETELYGRIPVPGYLPAPVPEPSTYALMLAGLLLVSMAARRKENGFSSKF